ncbi:non-homologous end-joining DNA ligase [Nocardioides cavernaquae]|uniref:ATP-dependent DNA ligase n=1 Tax=Nocardioides cavernaquae TaxID=2321396 RepID=A0A3A5H3V5_9ACTN|nr:non-homologous end-joining DNA ligase [Nocardioides cavernaquae]RJS45322.1 ATP-dependent DNA ligase [Nocardioides cavernaquae]
MPKAPAAEVIAGGRAVRISSPDRVIYEATERTPAITKLDVAEYFAAVGDAMQEWVHNRPTALERWPDGWREGMKLATGPQDKDAEGFYQKRIPRGAPDWVETARIAFPSRRTADEVCLTEAATAVWAAQMGTLTFHPWPCRRDDTDHPDELRIDLDPQPGTTFTDAVRVAGAARDLLVELGLTGLPKTSGNRGVHVFVPIRPEWTFEEVRHAALAFGRELAKRDPARVTTAWWKEERGQRIFVDFNQNNRDRTIASAYSLRPLPGAPVSTPVTWEELSGITDPRVFNLVTVRERIAAGDFPTYAAEQGDLTPLLDLWEADPSEANWPPDYPKMPGEPPRVQPSKKVAEHWDSAGNRITE